jgi:hypothetical protein
LSLLKVFGAIVADSVYDLQLFTACKARRVGDLTVDKVIVFVGVDSLYPTSCAIS